MGLLPGDGKLFRQIATPAGASLWIGLAVVGSLLLPDHFSYVRLRIGASLVLFSFALADLALSRGGTIVSYTGEKARSSWWFQKLVSGLFFLACSAAVLGWPLWPEKWRELLSSLVA
jgi:hypothetical protein